MYHNYATGGENGWAELEIEWISYDTFFEKLWMRYLKIIKVLVHLRII